MRWTHLGGVPQYFEWRGYPDISVLLEGQGDSFETLRERKDYSTIQATVPPLFPWKWNRNDSCTPLKPVRTVIYIDANGLGGWDSDFWVPANVMRCAVKGVYNPNVAGSSTYRETFEYRLYFSTGWRGKPVRLIEPQFVGGMKWSRTKVSISFVYNGKLTNYVPLDSFKQDWEKRPLIRVSITDTGPGWLTAYSNIEMDCQ